MAHEVSSSAQVVASLGAGAAVNFQHLYNKGWPLTLVRVWARNWPQRLRLCVYWEYSKGRILVTHQTGEVLSCYEKPKRQELCKNVTHETVKGNRRVLIFHLMKNIFNSLVIILFTF